MSETTTEVTEPEAKVDKTFTEAQVKAIIKQRLDQQAKNQFGDYDELKAQVEGAKTAEQKLSEQIAELQKKQAESEIRATRAVIAAEFGISTKKGDKDSPSDADLLLTGSDEATMRAQAQRVGTLEADRKKQGNVARKEGGTTTNGGEDGMREFARNLFQKAAAE